MQINQIFNIVNHPSDSGMQIDPAIGGTDFRLYAKNRAEQSGLHELAKNENIDL
jgi:hypothetical protein